MILASYPWILAHVSLADISKTAWPNELKICEKVMQYVSYFLGNFKYQWPKHSLRYDGLNSWLFLECTFKCFEHLKSNNAQNLSFRFCLIINFSTKWQKVPFKPHSAKQYNISPFEVKALINVTCVHSYWRSVDLGGD